MEGSFGRTLAIKLILVATILAIGGFHDFFLRPRASAAWESNPASADTLRLKAASGKVGPAQSAAGDNRNCPGRHAGARRALVEEKFELRSSKFETISNEQPNDANKWARPRRVT